MHARECMPGQHRNRNCSSPVGRGLLQQLLTTLQFRFRCCPGMHPQLRVKSLSQGCRIALPIGSDLQKQMTTELPFLGASID